MIILQNTENGKTIELTDDDTNAIYEALGDYQDYGDEEMEQSISIRDKITSIY